MKTADAQQMEVSTQTPENGATPIHLVRDSENSYRPAEFVDWKESNFIGFDVQRAVELGWPRVLSEDIVQCGLEFLNVQRYKQRTNRGIGFYFSFETRADRIHSIVGSMIANAFKLARQRNAKYFELQLQDRPLPENIVDMDESTRRDHYIKSLPCIDYRQEKEYFDLFRIFHDESMHVKSNLSIRKPVEEERLIIPVVALFNPRRD
jgi:hypothetical protein